MIYVLTLKTWKEHDIAHHWYGRIHWEVEDPCDHGNITMSGGKTTCNVCGADHTNAGFQSDDSLAEPDKIGFCSSRHDSEESVMAGAKRWFKAHANKNDVMIVGVWGLGGWERDWPYEVIEGTLTEGKK